MTEEELQEKILKLSKTPITYDNFNEFYSVAKSISLNYQETYSKNNKIVEVKTDTGMQRVYQSTPLLLKEIDYLLLWGHRYMETIGSTRTKCRIGHDFQVPTFSSSAFYDTNNQTIYYHDLRLLRNCENNIPEIWKTVFHENRHVQQFHAFQASSIREALKYDPNSLLILKDFLVMNYNGTAFYHSNHLKSLMENDANLYAFSLVPAVITEYFPEQNESLKIFDKTYISNKTLFDNPFQLLEEQGIIKGEYVLKDKSTIDRAIMLDQNLRKIITPQLVREYPILNLIYANGRMKNYDEIMQEKEQLLQQVGNEEIKVVESPNYVPEIRTKQQQVKALYGVIIKTDPMLYFEDLLSQEEINFQDIVQLFTDHPKLSIYYESQINDILSRKYPKISEEQRETMKEVFEKLNFKLPVIDSNVSSKETKSEPSKPVLPSIDELISRRSLLEEQLQQFRSMSQNMNAETFSQMVSIENEIKALSNRIGVIQSNQKIKDLNNIKDTLGFNFDDHIYTIAEDQTSVRKIPKTSSQIQREYMAFTRLLDKKLDSNSISEQRYQEVSNSLSNLYYRYKSDAVKREHISTHTNVSVESNIISEINNTQISNGRKL